MLVLAVGRDTNAYGLIDRTFSTCSVFLLQEFLRIYFLVADLESEENNYIVPSLSFALGYADFLAWQTAKPKHEKGVCIDADSMIAGYQVERIDINDHTFNSLEDYLYGRYVVLSTSIHYLLESVLALNTSAFYQPLNKVILQRCDFFITETFLVIGQGCWRKGQS